MKPELFLVFVGLICFGGSLLWIVRVFYGLTRPDADDTMRLVLTLAGTIMMIAGVILASVVSLHFISIVVLIVGGFYFFRAHAQLSHQEREMLMQTVAAALRRNIPISAAARSLSHEQWRNGQRTAKFAELLESGVPLSNALSNAGISLNSELLMAVRLSSETGDARELFVLPDRNETRIVSLAKVTETLTFLIGTALVGTLVLTFVMLKIVPVYSKMFQEFDLKLPAPTELLIASTGFFIKFLWIPFAFVVIPVLGLLLFFVTAKGMFEFLESAGYSLDGMPGLDLIRGRRDRRLVILFLGRLLARNVPLNGALDLLSRVSPRRAIRNLLKLVAQQVQNGVALGDALHKAGFTSSAELALIKSSERVGNLPWALGEVADARLRRESYTGTIFTSILTPLITVTFGFIVMFVVVALFMPLVALISGLSF